MRTNPNIKGKVVFIFYFLFFLYSKTMLVCKKKKSDQFLQIQKWKRREKWLVTLRVNLQSKREKFGISSIATKAKQHVGERNLEEEEVVDYLKFNKKN